jgi:citrate synthase
MKKKQYLTAKEAAAELGISVPTLYAYVSRKLIRSEPLDKRKRTKRYAAEDVEKLKAQKEQRRNPSAVVQGALHWGTPILESALTLIADNHFFYRGYDVLALAETYSVEQVATLLWTGKLLARASPLFESNSGQIPPHYQVIQAQLSGLAPIEAFQVLLPLAAVDDPLAYDLRPTTVCQTGAQILRLLTAIAANTPSAIAGIAETLQQSWLPQQPQAVKFIKTALILCADHELNVSSFTARCVASARSTPYQVVIAGLAALQGARHGRETERFEVFLEEVGSPAQAQDAVVNRLKRGESVPGCGHPLYPQGDPRAKVLLQMTQENYPEAPVVALVTAIGEAAQAVMGEYLTLDAGLVTVSQALNLPPGGAITLFALGRTIGWIGHALEAYEDNRLIRPRAKYVGTPPRQE